jgi:predicted DNA-binding antitoxin AbrB/MazE fold protein
MIHDVDAIYDHGVFRPVEPLAFAEGARVRLRVEEDNGGAAAASKEAADYEAWLDGLAGRWQGDFARGHEGDFETREPLP